MNSSFSASRSPHRPWGRSSPTPGIDPAPKRASSTGAQCLRSPADALLACDFFDTVTRTGHRATFLIRDRDGTYPPLFDTILADAGIPVVLPGIQMPRRNSIMERWIPSCRHELLDRTLIGNPQHLIHALRTYEEFSNSDRPHPSIANTRPLQPLPQPITDQDQITSLSIRRRPRFGGILNEYHHTA